MLGRNCEHFSSWCKTGSTKSSQVSVFWASLGRMAVSLILRMISLVILFFIQWSHEESEEICQGNSTVTSMVSTVTKGRCADNETMEKVLSYVYIGVVTVIFTIHLLITSGKQLAVDPSSIKTRDTENPCNCCHCCYDKCPDKIAPRCICCLLIMFGLLVCRAVCCLCRHIKSCPCICCRRPGTLVCGLFWRIFLREVSATFDFGRKYLRNVSTNRKSEK